MNLDLGMSVSLVASQNHRSGTKASALIQSSTSGQTIAFALLVVSGVQYVALLRPITERFCCFVRLSDGSGAP